MAFLDEPEPIRFTPTHAAPGISRLLAPNPGPMTHHGTNTWLLDGPDGLTVIDPGPNDARHLAAITAAGPVHHILLTHTHPDHLAGAPALQAATGAPIAGWAKPWDPTFTPDIPLANNDTIAGLTALHTPGHASDHVCFAQPDTGVLFSGDHVMSWSTSIVSPPDGNMAAYMASLRLLLARDDRLYLCGHGPALPDPAKLVRGMLNHRAAREAAVLATLERGPATPDELVTTMYAGLTPLLMRAAKQSVLAHLLKLASEGRVFEDDAVWRIG